MIEPVCQPSEAVMLLALILVYRHRVHLGLIIRSGVSSMSISGRKTSPWMSSGSVPTLFGSSSKSLQSQGSAHSNRPRARRLRGVQFEPTLPLRSHSMRQRRQILHHYLKFRSRDRRQRVKGLKLMGQMRVQEGVVSASLCDADPGFVRTFSFCVHGSVTGLLDFASLTHWVSVGAFILAFAALCTSLLPSSHHHTPIPLHADAPHTPASSLFSLRASVRHFSPLSCIVGIAFTSYNDTSH